MTSFKIKMGTHSNASILATKLAEVPSTQANRVITDSNGNAVKSVTFSDGTEAGTGKLSILRVYGAAVSADPDAKVYANGKRVAHVLAGPSGVILVTADS